MLSFSSVLMPAGEMLSCRYFMLFILGVPVYISNELFGSDTFINDFAGSKVVTVGEIYFKPDKLRNWSAGSYQTIDLFEKIRMVGKGIHGLN